MERTDSICNSIRLSTVQTRATGQHNKNPLCHVSVCSEEIKYSPVKYIETTERGLVVITVNEGDGGRYDCILGGSLLCSYSITVDAHR